MFKKIIIAICTVLIGRWGAVESEHADQSHHLRRILQTNVTSATLPSTSTSMRDLLILLKLLEDNVPFGYAHFNDGEINALNCPDGGETDWGWQKCSSSLKDAMIRSMSRTAHNFYIGITCSCEFNMKPWVITMDILNITHTLPYSSKKLPTITGDPCPDVPPVLKFPSEQLKIRLTVATIFINGNNAHARKELVRILNKAINEQGRAVHVVTAEGHTTDRLPFKVKSVIRAAKHHAFDRDYEAFRSPAFVDKTKFAPNDIVLIMAGPFGRIIASGNVTIITHHCHHCRHRHRHPLIRPSPIDIAPTTLQPSRARSLRTHTHSLPHYTPSHNPAQLQNSNTPTHTHPLTHSSTYIF